MISLIVSVVSTAIVLAVLAYLYYEHVNTKKYFEKSLTNMVNQINAANTYQYKFDKVQEANIKNMEDNTVNMDARIRQMEEKVKLANEAIDSKVKEVSQGSLTASSLANGVPIIKTPQLNVDDYSLVQKVDTAGSLNIPWLSVADKTGKEYQGGIASEHLLVKDTATINGKVAVADSVAIKGASSEHNKERRQTIFAASDGKNYVRGDTDVTGNMNITGDLNIMRNATMRGGVSEHNPSNLPSQFPSVNDNKNYLRGDTEIQGNTKHIGDVNMGRNMNVNGKMFFKDPSYSVTGNVNNGLNAFYLEKLVDPERKSQLRLTLNDNPDVSFQIWGNSCAEVGGCSGPGAVKHIFDAVGNAEHKGNHTVGSLLSRSTIQGTNVVAVNSDSDNSKNAWLSAKSEGNTLSFGMNKNNSGIVINNTKPFAIYDNDGERMIVEPSNTTVRSKLTAKEMCVGSVCLNESEVGALKAMLSTSAPATSFTNTITTTATPTTPAFTSMDSLI